VYVLRSEPKNFFADGGSRLVKRYTIGVKKVSDNAEKFHTFDTASYIPVKYHESVLSRSSHRIEDSLEVTSALRL